MSDLTADGKALPPEIGMSEVAASADFRVMAPAAALWFERGNGRLIVSFDNLATLDEPYPRKPWLNARLAELGYSVLGVQSFAKDWYRNADAPQLVRDLAATGFFRQFEHVVFTGASMGGFGAINLATFVPGARVIAFSPQSTMSTEITPFERRFPWAVRNSDWTSPEFLDAAQSAHQLERLVILYDGRSIEDRLHAMRLNGPNVQLLRLDHTTHEAVRVVMKCGALAPLFEEVIETDSAGPGFWSAMRRRRTVRKWARSFMDQVSASGRPARIEAVGNTLIKQENYLFARRALAAICKKDG